MEQWLRRLHDDSLIESFINNVDLLFGQDSTVEDELDDISFRRIFQAACYLEDIETDVEEDIIPLIEISPYDVVYPSFMKGRMKNFMRSGIRNIKDYVVTKYKYIFKTSDLIESLEARIINKLTSKDNHMVFCLHCETSYPDSQWIMGARCPNCTGWWILHSLEENIDDVEEGIDFEDGIAKIMKVRMDQIEEEIMATFHLKVVTPYVPGNTEECRSCSRKFGNSLVWDTTKCKLLDPEIPQHWVCFSCGYGHMMIQVQNSQPIRCMLGCGVYDPNEFLAMCGNRTVIDFIRIYGRSYEIRFLREHQGDN